MLENKENYDPVSCLYTPIRNPNRNHNVNQNRQALKDVTKKYVPVKTGQVNLLTINANSGVSGTVRMR